MTNTDGGAGDDGRMVAPLSREGLPAAGGDVEAAEAARMCELFGRGESVEAIGAALERPADTVRQVLARFTPTIDAARKRLEGGALDAADRWVELAKTSNRHEAARDLLLHTGTITPVDGGGTSGPRVVVVVGVPGAPAGPDPFAGVVLGPKA